VRARVALVPAAAVVALAAAASISAQTATYVPFRTPSGNIACAASDAPVALRCDIRSGLRPTPPRRSNCPVDFGDSVGMGKRGRPYLVCHGDTVIDPRARVVRYGSSIRVLGFKCTSRTTGLTCANASGHGWFLSRERYRLF
jgi:hypothetical protein